MAFCFVEPFWIYLLCLSNLPLCYMSPTCNKDSSSYVNLCGRCVAGSSVSEDISGVDECNTCFGSNDCMSCQDSQSSDECKSCLKPYKNCPVHPEIFPRKVDLASHEQSVHLILRGLDVKDYSILQNVTCKLKNSINSTNSTNTFADQLGIHIEFNKSHLVVGAYKIECNNIMTPENMETLHSPLVIVDSRLIKINAVVPKKAPVNTIFEANLDVSLKSEQLDGVLCFLFINSFVEMIVKGDVLSQGQILCKNLFIKNSHHAFIGVSESLDSILDNPRNLNLKEIKTDFIGPVMRRSLFSSDLRQIYVEFDGNVENIMKDCHEVFSEETQQLLGAGWQCWVKANEIVIQLGLEPTIQPGSRISITSEDGVQARGMKGQSNPVLPESAIIVDDVTNQAVAPLYSLLAPQAVCYGGRTVGFQSSLLPRGNRRSDAKEAVINEKSVTVVEVQELGGQNLVYNWSVTFTPSKTENLRSQRNMLMTWLSVRLLDKSVKSTSLNRVVLNNSLMLTGTEYTLSVQGRNSLGIAGELKEIPLRLLDHQQALEHRARSEDLSVRACSSGTPLDVMLLSSPATFADAECWVEVSLSCCDGVLVPDLLIHVDYIWSVQAANGHEVNVMYNHGKRLVIPPYSLQGGRNYNISCVLLHKVNKKKIGSAFTTLSTLERGIEINVNVSAVTLSTKHPLILDASSSIDIDNKPGDLEFRWSCKIITETSNSFHYGDKQCYIPGVQKTLLSEKYNISLKKPLLWLPPGSLPIGRYLFSVEASKQAHASAKSGFVSTEVNIVGGSPPLISLVSKNGNENFLPAVISPEEDVILSGLVSELKPGCRVQWTVINNPGCSYLNQSLLRQEKFVASTYDIDPHEFVVELPRGLAGDAKYCFRLSAWCPSPNKLGVEVSSADLVLKTDAPPIVKPLRVEPLQGQAITTLFKFSTEPAYDDLLDYPLRYSFGFRLIEPISSHHSAQTNFFHSTSRHLSAVTYLPAMSPNITRIQSVLLVCDVRHICHAREGPQISILVPEHLTPAHIEQLSDSFTSLIMTEEYEDAAMVVESSLATLEVLSDKSLFELASQKIEQSINSQVDLLLEKLDESPGSVHAALRFLKVANAALKQGSFAKSSLEKLVTFKDKVLSKIHSISGTYQERQVEFRIKRQSPTSQKSIEQPWNFLQPEMVKAILSISEVAILKLNDSRGALSEKHKLLQNVSFFMDSLCQGLRNPTPVFIGSKVVSFSIQRLNLQVKYKDDLAVPDWRSAKYGGAPINATAMVLLGESVLHVMGRDTICMGASFYPMDFLSDVFGKCDAGSRRHSAVFQVKLIKDTKGHPPKSLVESYDGLDVKLQSIQIKVPIWSDSISSREYLECRVWHNSEWSGHYCKLTKFVTLINKPAVECLCSVIGYHAVFAVESPWSTDLTSSKPSTYSSSTSLSSSSTRSVLPTSTMTQLPTTTKPVTMLYETEKVTHSSPTVLPEGIPLVNTSQNFTFMIQEDFSKTVGTHHEAFISQLKRDILKQVEMPKNMIAGIDVRPGSILVTLHLVDTDIRTVDDVLPSLASALQEGRLSVNGVDGRHLSVPPQSLKLLQHRSENSALPWVVVGCALFGIVGVCSVLIAAVVVTRKQQQQRRLSNDPPTPVTKARAVTYGRFHLEQTLDGSEATISRYRNSNNNPLVVSTVGGMASVMGTNAKIPDSYQSLSFQYKLHPPHNQSRSLSLPRNSSNANSVSGSVTQSNSSGNSISNSIPKRSRTSSSRLGSSTEDRKPILNSEEVKSNAGEDYSHIVMKDSSRSNAGSHLYDFPNGRIGTPPEVPVLPGTPSNKSSEPEFK